MVVSSFMTVVTVTLASFHCTGSSTGKLAAQDDCGVCRTGGADDCNENTCICSGDLFSQSQLPQGMPKYPEFLPDKKSQLKQPVANNLQPRTDPKKWSKRIKNVVPTARGHMVYTDPTGPKQIVTVLSSFHITYVDGKEADVNFGLECTRLAGTHPQGAPEPIYPGFHRYHRVKSSKDGRLYHVIAVQ